MMFNVQLMSRVLGFHLGATVLRLVGLWCCHCHGHLISVWSPNSKLLVAAVLAPWDLGCSVLQLAWCKVFQLSCPFVFVLLEEF